MTEQQKQALKDLKELLIIATACGALDYLQGIVDSPDSINDVVDAISQTV
jgi:hypothetical protein